MTLHLQPSTLRESYAARVQRVESPGGITAWLLEDHTLPLLSMSFAFRGGAAIEAQGKGGSARLLAALMTEGAGPLDNVAFAKAVSDRAIRIGFDTGRDSVSGGLKTLTEHAEHAFDLMGFAVRTPHFSLDALDRVREATASEVRAHQNNPNHVANRSFNATAFGDHPYGRPGFGDLDSLASIERSDIVALHRRMMTRGNLRVAVVGSIDAGRLGDALDRVFAELPAEIVPPTPSVSLKGLGQRITTQIDVDQTTICFGRPGLGREDPDFVPAVVVNHCFGGGAFTSRLFRSAREERGLCYSIGSDMRVEDAASTFRGMTSTRNDRVEEMLDVIATEFSRLGRDGIDADELEKAKSFLTGSYGLNFDTSDSTAGMLLALQLEGRDVTWLDRRNARVAAVSQDDAARAIARLVGDGTMLVTLAGNPSPLGLTS